MGSLLSVNPQGIEMHPKLIDPETGKPYCLKPENEALRNEIVQVAYNPAAADLFDYKVVKPRPVPERNIAFEPAWTEFRERLMKVDGVLFVSPEYNRSIPGPLKNAIDWASRPYGQNSFARKPTAIIGASTGRIGTAVMQSSLRSVLAFCDSPQLNAPEAYIYFTPQVFGEDGEIKNEDTKAFLTNYMKQFLEFIIRVLTVVPQNKP